MRREWNKIFYNLAFVVVVLITGCQSAQPTFLDEPERLPAKVESASDVTIDKLQKQLNKHGIRIIYMGDNYLISIPSSMLFATQSPRLTWDSYSFLNNIVCYLQQFRKVAITITAYSSKCISEARELALTRARAVAVADYLNSQGIDSRFIFTKGAGSDKPISIDGLQNDESVNSRIEITFRHTVI